MPILNMIYWASWSWPASEYTITWSTSVGSFTLPQFSDLQGFFMSPDGLNAYATFWNNWSGRMAQYSLSTARNISTATQVRYISLAKPNWFCFSNDGVYMFYSTETDNSIKRYTLSTPRDISTAVQDSGQSLSSTWSFAFNVCITENGEYIYFSPDVSRKLYQYQLTTPYDLTTATNQKTLSTTQRSASAAVVNRGKYLLLAWPDGEAIKQYELSTPYDITSTLTEVGSCSISYGEARAFYVSDDCRYWVIWNNNSKVTEYESQPM